MSIQIINSCQAGETTYAEIKAILNADKKTATFSLPCKISQIVNCNVNDTWITNVAGSQTNKVVNFILTAYIKDILLRPYVSQTINTNIHAPEQPNFFPESGWSVSLVKTTPTNNSNEVQIVGGEIA